MTRWHSGWRLWLLVVAAIAATLAVTYALGGMNDNGQNDRISVFD
jgi:hypothetical protein